MKKILLVLAAVALVLAGALFAIGATTPKDHTASSRASFAASEERVWSLVADIASWPSWNSAFDTAERGLDRDGRPYWVLKGSFGPMPSVVEVSEAPSRMVTRIPADAGLGFSGTWTYALAPSGGGCTLTLTEDGHVESLLFRALGRISFDNHSSLNAFLVDLVAHVGLALEPEEL